MKEKSIHVQLQNLVKKFAEEQQIKVDSVRFEYVIGHSYDGVEYHAKITELKTSTCD